MTPPMRLQSRLGPDSGHAHVVNTHLRCQLATAPVSGAIGRFAVQGPIDNASLLLGGIGLGDSAPMPAPKTRQPLSEKAPLPEPDGVQTATLLPSDSRKALPAGGQRQDDIGPAGVLHANTAAAAHSIQLTSLWGTKDDTFDHFIHLSRNYSELTVTLHKG
jgi:hypothetical protein